MAPPSRTTATTTLPAPAPPSPRDTRGRPSRSGRSGGWRRPRCWSGRRSGSPERPLPTPSRRPRSPCRPRRPPPPLRPRPLPPRPRRKPLGAQGAETAATASRDGPSRPHRGPRHAASAGNGPRAGPERLAESCRNHSGGQGGRQVRGPDQAQPHPHQPPEAVPARPRPVRPPAPTRTPPGIRLP